MNKQTSAKDSGTGILPVVLAFSEKLDRLEAYPTALPQRSICRKFQRRHSALPNWRPAMNKKSHLQQIVGQASCLSCWLFLKNWTGWKPIPLLCRSAVFAASSSVWRDACATTEASHE